VADRSHLSYDAQETESRAARRLLRVVRARGTGSRPRGKWIAGAAMTLLALLAGGLWTQVHINPRPPRVESAVGVSEARGTSSAGAMVAMERPRERTIGAAANARLQRAESRPRMLSAPPSEDLASADADAELRVLPAARARCDRRLRRRAAERCIARHHRVTGQLPAARRIEGVEEQ